MEVNAIQWVQDKQLVDFNYFNYTYEDYYNFEGHIEIYKRLKIFIILP